LGRLSQRSICGIAAEDHSAQFIAQTACRFRILLVTETLCQRKELVLFPLVRLDPVLDQLDNTRFLLSFRLLAMLPTCLANPPGRLTLWRTAFSAIFITPLCTKCVDRKRAPREFLSLSFAILTKRSGNFLQVLRKLGMCSCRLAIMDPAGSSPG